ncbi:hypothetical protein ACFYNO_24995 [Kitasatospora sp. NPDC006697]|uniref:hypothetical protein n=1 Tax=Kitasatospora sp. NPDC006697 TaxID=3364020 RepID=UPI0036A1E139
MRLIVAGQMASTPQEFEELALGVDLDTDPDDDPAAGAVHGVVRDLQPVERRFKARLLRSADRVQVREWKAA